MSLIEVIFVAVALAMDALAVSIATSISLTKVTPAQILRMSGAFGFFQFFMPVLGWLGGAAVVSYIEKFDHWVAFGLLAFIGLQMIFEKEEADEAEENHKDSTKGLTLLILAVATSIDALAVGFSMAMVESNDGLNIWLSTLLIGIITMAISAAGMIFGAKLGEKFKNIAGKVGGLVLLGIGIKILLEHLLGA